MSNRITKRLATLAILCVLIMAFAATAFAASYSKVYGQTQDRIRVRASASTSATVIDNIVKGACVYVTDSKTSGSTTYIRINYRNSSGDVDSGWVCQSDSEKTYVKILSAEQAQKSFSVKSGKLPGRKVGTFTAAQRNSAENKTTTADGTSAETIKTVQTKLKALGYYHGEITGNIGAKTETAIKDFQRANGLTPDGVPGPKTLAKLNATSGTTTTTTGNGLRLNSTGTAVRNLQIDLTTLGYYWADITGNFGAKTEAAVKTFQQRNGLKADGVAGTKTLNAIAAAVERKGGSSYNGYADGTVLKLNSQGAAVTQLQKDLKQLGYYYADITGNFGTKTEAAVKEFQKRHSINPDGVAGTKTLKAIADAIANAGGSVTDGTGLKYGSTGEKVRALQADLTALGYYYGDITGHYGSLTQTAVKKFQKAKGLVQDGIAGTSTLNAIAKALGGNSTVTDKTAGSALREGDSGPAVLEMQTMLKELGYYYGELTGNFGSITKKAVRKFQDDNGLTVDGIAGVNTLNLLRAKTGRENTGGGTGNTVGNVTSYSVAEKDSYGKISKNNVNLRSSYTTTSASKASLKEGKLVRITRSYNVGGTVWYYITVPGTVTHKGYVRSDMVTRITETEYKNGGGNTDTDTGTQEILGMIRITANNVNIRETDSSSSKSMGKANLGDVFYYIDTKDGWFQIQSGYWIKKTYAVVMTEDEVNNYVGGDGYAGGTYKKGDTGSMVLWIQEALDDLNYYSGSKTGHYGDLTVDAVRRFQRDHGLDADGVAGPRTIQAIIDAVNGKGGGSTTTTKLNPVIYNLSWFNNLTVYTNTAGIKKSTTLTLWDISKSVSFKVKVQSVGNHVDIEPATAADTAALCRLYNVANSSQLESMNKYQRRAVVVTAPNGQQFVGSIYAIPHGLDTVSGNDFDGQFCLHFKDSKTHGTDRVDTDTNGHQDKITAGANALKKMKAGDGVTTITVKTTYP